MAEDTKNTQKEFQKFCQGMDFTNLMRKMMEAKKEGHPFNCAEMMSRMMKTCCAEKKRKEGSTPESKENPAPGQ